MTVRKRVAVDEDILIDMMADGIPIDYKKMPRSTESKEKKETTEKVTLKEEKEILEKNTPKESIKSSRKKKEKSSYEELYLANTSLGHNRQQIYIEGELYEKLHFFLKGILKSKISMSAFITNIAFQHCEENKDMMDELYEVFFKNHSK